MWDFLAFLSQLPCQIERLENAMGAVADALAGVNDKLAKAKTEIVGKIAALEAQLADAGKLDADDQAAIDAVKAAAQGLDDVVPDAPVDEPPVEPTPDQPIA